MTKKERFGAGEVFTDGRILSRRGMWTGLVMFLGIVNILLVRNGRVWHGRRLERMFYRPLRVDRGEMDD